MSQLLLLSLNNDPTIGLGSLHAGGQSKYVLELTKHLLFNHWMVDVVTIGELHSERIKEVTPGFRIVRFLRTNNQPYGYSMNADEVEALTPDIVDFIHAGDMNYTAILACYWLSAISGSAISKQENIPLYISFCSLGAFKEQVESTFNIQHRIKWEKRTARLATGIIATTHHEKCVLIDRYGIDEKSIYVIPRGIDPGVFHP